MSIFDSPVISITQEDMEQLLFWADVEPGNGISNETKEFHAAGDCRNILRWAEKYGTKILAILIKQNMIEKYEDPIECIGSLLKKYDDLSG